MDIQVLPAHFTLAQFRRAAPLNETNIWEFLFDRNSARIGVKRRDTAVENLEKIFLATFRLANTVGFPVMTLRDLCRETGLSMGGLYAYIENKDQLAAMIEDLVRHVTQMLPAWFAHITQPAAQIESIVRANIFLAEMFQPWLYFVFLESRTLQPAQRDDAKAAELFIQSHLTALFRNAGEFDDGAAALLAAHCMSLVQDWHLKRWKFRAANVRADAFADSVIDLLRSRLAAARARLEV
jgi:AcrR family transcriptional regulator